MGQQTQGMPRFRIKYPCVLQTAVNDSETRDTALQALHEPPHHSAGGSLQAGQLAPNTPQSSLGELCGQLSGSHSRGSCGC